MTTTPPAAAGELPALPARTHHEAAMHLRRPFGAGGVDFRTMSDVTLNGVPYGGAEIAVYLNAQAVSQRLNAVVPGRWTMEFFEPPSALTNSWNSERGAFEPGKKRYLGCRLTISLPTEPGGDDRLAVYEDIGAMEAGNWEGLKTLYSDARKRVAVQAGIGTYLYTALQKMVLPIFKPSGGEATPSGHVRSFHDGKRWQKEIGAELDQALREAYLEAVTRPETLADLGPVLTHGEPAKGNTQGDGAEGAPPPSAETEVAAPAPTAPPASAPAGPVAVPDAPGAPSAPEMAAYLQQLQQDAPAGGQVLQFGALANGNGNGDGGAA